MDFANTLITCTDAVPNLWLFFDTTLAPDLLYYSYIPIAAISIILGIVILIKDNYSLQGKLFFLLATFLTLNIINEIILWVSIPAGIINFGWALSLFFRVLILAVTLYFAYAFVQKKDLPFRYKIIGSIIMVPTIFLLPTNLNVTAFDIDWCGAINGPLWLYLYFLEAISIALLGIYCFIWFYTTILMFSPYKTTTCHLMNLIP